MRLYDEFQCHPYGTSHCICISFLRSASAKTKYKNKDRTYAVGVPSLRQSGILHFNVCGFFRATRGKNRTQWRTRSMECCGWIHGASSCMICSICTTAGCGTRRANRHHHLNLVECTRAERGKAVCCSLPVSRSCAVRGARSRYKKGKSPRCRRLKCLQQTSHFQVRAMRTAEPDINRGESK